MQRRQLALFVIVKFITLKLQSAKKTMCEKSTTCAYYLRFGRDIPTYCIPNECFLYDLNTYALKAKESAKRARETKKACILRSGKNPIFLCQQ